MGHASEEEPMGWSDAELDSLFAEAEAGLAPSDALMARVLADAAAVQAASVQAGAGQAGAVRAGERPVGREAPPPARSFWTGLAAVFGGGGALAGLGTAALAGLYLGFAQPSALTSLTAGFSSDVSIDSMDLMPGIDALLAEE